MKSFMLTIVLFFIFQLSGLTQNKYDVNKLSFAWDTTLSKQYLSEGLNLNILDKFKKDSVVIIKIKFNKPDFDITLKNVDGYMCHADCTPKKYQINCIQMESVSDNTYDKVIIKKKSSDENIEEQCIEIINLYKDSSIKQEIYINETRIDYYLIGGFYPVILLNNLQADNVKISIYH